MKAMNSVGVKVVDFPVQIGKTMFDMMKAASKVQTKNKVVVFI